MHYFANILILFDRFVRGTVVNIKVKLVISLLEAPNRIALCLSDLTGSDNISPTSGMCLGLGKSLPENSGMKVK